MKEVYFRVKGRVQGIGFRYWAVKKAQEIGDISGWVHNAADGSVEILALADDNKIDEFILACNKGPMLARVDKLEFIVGRRSTFMPPIELGKFKRV
ncbi:MAG: acylphosphatase [Alphaproteobacteria bacterium]|nr:acylphosphatase [Alphaproteobacteria bacterium]